MAKSKILTFVSFGIIFLFVLMNYIPASDNAASLTTDPFGVESLYTVDSNWSEEGVIDGLVTDEDIIYAEANQIGNWTGRVQDEPDSQTIRLEANGDPRDGTITLFVNAWEDLPNGDTPDNTFVTTLSDFSINESFEAGQYNYFNVVVEIEETSGSNNLRPRLDSFSLEFLDRSGQFGMRNETFRIFTLFVLLGAGLIALIRMV